MQIHIKKQQHLFSHRKPFLKLNLLNPSIHTYKTKYTYTNIRHKLSKWVSPFNIALVKKKKHIRLGHTGTGDHSIWFIDTKEKYKKGLDRNNVKKKSKIILYKCIMANASAKQHHTARTTYQLSSPSCSTRAIQKAHLLMTIKYGQHKDGLHAKFCTHHAVFPQSNSAQTL